MFCLFIFIFSVLSSLSSFFPLFIFILSSNFPPFHCFTYNYYIFSFSYLLFPVIFSFFTIPIFFLSSFRLILCNTYNSLLSFFLLPFPCHIFILFCSHFPSSPPSFANPIWFPSYFLPFIFLYPRLLFVPFHPPSPTMPNPNHVPLLPQFITSSRIPSSSSQIPNGQNTQAPLTSSTCPL